MLGIQPASDIWEPQSLIVAIISSFSSLCIEVHRKSLEMRNLVPVLPSAPYEIWR